MRIRSWRSHPDFPASTESLFRGFWEYELKAGENGVPHQHGIEEVVDELGRVVPRVRGVVPVLVLEADDHLVDQGQPDYITADGDLIPFLNSDRIVDQDIG